MATSGSNDFSVTARDIVTDSLKIANVLSIGQMASSSQINDGIRLLNLLSKHWQSEGLYLWARKRATLFLALNTSEYDLGPSGDNATASYTETAIATAGAASDSTIEVDSITGLSDADYIGIELDDGSLQWTTINGTPSGTTVTLTASLSSAAAVDNAVYAYTTKIDRPLRILDMWRRDSSNSDIPIEMVSTSEYNEQNSKTADGKVVTASYDPQLTDGKLRVWPEPDEVTDSIEFWFHRPFEDFDSSTDNPDFPQEWYLALTYGIANMMADIYSINHILASRINKRATQYKDEVLSWSAEDTSIYFEPEVGFK